MALKSIKPRLALLDPRRVKPAAKQADDFYGSSAWKAMRSQVIQQQGRQCRHCGTDTGRMYVDHVVEIRDGGDRLDPTNMQVLCQKCHSVKTAAERARRIKSGS